MDHSRIKDVLNNRDTIVIVEQEAPSVRKYQDKTYSLASHGTQTLRCDKDHL